MVLRPTNGLSLCAGAGGLDMGLMLAEPGFHTRAFVEWEGYPRSAIIAAQRAGYFSPAPIWDDLATLDARPLAGAIDTLLAGYPCQPFSLAGNRLGEDDPRHLWPHVARVARELGDSLEWIFLENVNGHVSLGAEAVLRELRSMGFTPAAGIFSAQEVGATHERQRWFCVAHRAGRGRGAIRDAAQSRRGRHIDGCSCNMARADGGHACAERQFSGGEQRFQPEGGGIGSTHVADTSCGRCAGYGEGQNQRQGRAEVVGASNGLADTEITRSQGQQSGQRDASGRQEPHGQSGLHRGAGIFPPGPRDTSEWAEVIASYPDLAPALSVRDVKRAADHFAALVEGGHLAEAEAQSELCRMVDGLADRTRALRLLGNGVCSLAAANAWRALSGAHGLGSVGMDAATRG